MSRSCFGRCLSALLVALAAVPVPAAGIDVQIGNGDQVTSTLADPAAVERFRVLVPAGGKIIATVKGKKTKTTAAPNVSLRVLDDFEDDVSDGLVKQTKAGAKAKIPVEFTGEYIVEVFGDGASTGDYALTVKWTSARSVKIKDEELFDAGDETEIEVPVDADALLTMVVKKKGNSSAKPFFDRIEGDDFDQDLSGAAKLKNVRVEGGGDVYVVIGNESGEGPITGVIKIKPPKAAKRKIMIRSGELETEEGVKAATGAVASASRETLIEADDEDVVGAAIVGSSVLIPPGAVKTPTAIVIGTSPVLPVPTESELEGAGPTVFFGPSGLQFLVDVTVTIPFDSDGFEEGDEDELQIFTRDSQGNVTEIFDFTVNLDDGTVTFPVSHFSSFRAFRKRKPARFDLNGDGKNDLILPAPGFGSGHVYVFFDPVDEGALSTAGADLTIGGDGAGDGFGQSVVVGDLNGDKHADLVVLGREVNDGSAHVFFGGPTFGPTTRTQADVRIVGAVGVQGFHKAAIGDVNGDGIADLALSSETGTSGNGEVYVFFGGAGLTNGTTSAADVVITGEQNGDLFGADVEIRDVTGDGRPDLVVGADMIDNPGRTGKVYVVPGGTGISSGPAAALPIILSGSAADAGFGLNVALGDLTGDGVADLAVSEFDEILGGPGRVYVFAGGAGLATATTSAAIVSFVGDGTDDLLGQGLEIFDLDENGVGDLILGAPGYNDASGAIYVIAGGALSGTDRSPGTAAVTSDGFLEDFPTFGAPLRLNGQNALVVFAPGNEDGGLSAGAAYVFLAPPAPGSTTADADIEILGQDDDNLGGAAEIPQ